MHLHSGPLHTVTVPDVMVPVLHAAIFIILLKRGASGREVCTTDLCFVIHRHNCPRHDKACSQHSLDLPQRWRYHKQPLCLNWLTVWHLAERPGGPSGTSAVRGRHLGPSHSNFFLTSFMTVKRASVENLPGKWSSNFTNKLLFPH